VLATLVALLLTASSLSQVAHFLLVPHAICAEHGELLELTESPARVIAARAHDGDTETQAKAAGTEAAEHDHCQIFARSQRQQVWPPAPAVAVAPAVASARSGCVPTDATGNAVLPRLLVAPKTSPPQISLV
jgi:hypothetical protein